MKAARSAVLAVVVPAMSACAHDFGAPIGVLALEPTQVRMEHLCEWSGRFAKQDLRHGGFWQCGGRVLPRQARRHPTEHDRR